MRSTSGRLLLKGRKNIKNNNMTTRNILHAASRMLRHAKTKHPTARCRRLVITLLLMLLTTATTWADSLGTLTLGANNLNLPGSDGNSLSYTYTFTPTENGTYRFWSESATSLGYAQVQLYVQSYGSTDFYDDEPSEGHFDCQGELTANVEYELVFNVIHAVGDITVHIEKIDPSVLTLGENTVAFPYNEEFTCTFTPTESGNYHFYTDDTYADTMITINNGEECIGGDDDSGNEKSFDCTVALEGGTTYTLVLRSFNYSGYLTVTIEKVSSSTPDPDPDPDPNPDPDPTTLTVGDNTVTMVSLETVTRTFTPTVSGYYRFYSSGTIDTKITIKDGDTTLGYDDDSGDGNNFDYTTNTVLTSGHTYTLELYAYAFEGSGDVTVTIEKVAISSLSLGDNLVPFTEGETTTLTFTTSEEGSYRFYSTGDAVDTKITIQQGGAGTIGSDDNSGDGNNFDCTVPLSWGTQFTVELYSNSGTGDVAVTIEKVADPDPITVYFQCTAEDWTQPYVRYFDSSYNNDVICMTSVSSNIWTAEIPFYSERFWFSKDDTYNDETRTTMMTTDETTYPVAAMKNSTESFGRYFIGNANPFIYSINISPASNGTITAKLYGQDEPWSTGYAYNDWITLTLTPATGYSIGTVSYNDGSEDHEITADPSGNYGFRMPTSNVTVSATFTKVSSYYIVSTITDWQIDSNYQLVKNTEADSEEYMIQNVPLTTSDQFKVVYYDANTGNWSWFPEGMGNNYGENGEITSDGIYDIYFRPNYDGGDDWFYNCIYAAWLDETVDVDVTFAPEGFATYYNNMCDVILPEGVKARIVTSKGDSEGALTYETIADGDDSSNNIIPAGTAVMLQTAASDAAQQKTLTLSAKAAAAYTGTNLLHGSDNETTTYGGAKYYKLTYNTSGQNFGWYWGAENGAAFTIPGHKAWLALPANAPAFLGLPDYETTGVTPLLSPEGEDEGASPRGGLVGVSWYTLDGRKLNGKPTAKGLYIYNGKKVAIK